MNLIDYWDMNHIKDHSFDQIEIKILTGIWDVAVIILGVHAILEDIVELITVELLTCLVQRKL